MSIHWSFFLLLSIFLISQVACWSISIDYRRIASDNGINEFNGEGQERVDFIFPGTKWCGSGNISESYDDLGVFESTDRCCRDHDYCDDVIEAHESKHNLTNSKNYARVHCSCDEKFYDCLHSSDDRIANQIGTLYFSLLNTQCFRKDYPIVSYVTSSVEVHFENKDGGFFLKHLPRQYYPVRTDRGMTSSLPVNIPVINSSSSSSSPSLSSSSSSSSSPSSTLSSSSSSVLSVDKFTVFQTSEPASVRATYGPFSTKQTVPARYIVPDPLDALPDPETRRNVTATSNAALIDAQELGSRHLDMSAHLVGTSIPRDSPVLRVLFHAGSEAGTRRQILLARHQRVCVILHATLPGKTPLSAACSPDGEDGVCLAQITIPADWWPPFPPPDINGKIKFIKTPLKYVQVAYSVLEPRTIIISNDGLLNNNDGYGASRIQSQSDNFGVGGGCRPRVQIQPVTPLGRVPLTPNRAEYKELNADDFLLLLIPHGPLYPRSRLHVPAFLHPQGFQIATSSETMFDNRELTSGPLVVAVVLRARVKSGIRILDATSSNPNWSLASEINGKNTAATFTIRHRENAPRSSNTTAEELMTMLLEASEDGAGSNSWDGGRIMWTVRYTYEGDEEDITLQTKTDQLSEQIQLQRQQQQQQQQQHHHHHHHHQHVDRRKLQARLEIQKDDIQSVLPISKNWEVMNTAVLTGRQVSQVMKVFIVSQAGTVADVTLQSSCHSEDESVLKVSSSCSSVYVDGSEIRGSSNASVLVKYGTYTGLASFTVWMPEFPLEVTVNDARLSQIKSWKVPEGHPIQKNKRSLNHKNENILRNKMYKRSIPGMDEDDDDDIDEDVDTERFQIDDKWDNVNTLDRSPLQSVCRLRFQQSQIDIHARFLATGHDSGRETYFVNRRTWLRVTDFVVGLVRVSDPRIATLIQDRIVQGRGVGRTEVQVLSPITGRVIGAKEIRVGNDRVSISRLSVKVVSGLQLTISPDSAIENGYVAETSVTRRLTAQYQEGLLDIDVEFSDGMRTPLREIAVSDYHLVVESLNPDVVAFAPMVASHHPRVIAVGEGHGDLLRVNLQLSDICRQPGSKRSKAPPRANGSMSLAAATANVEVEFVTGDLPHRPEFVQNDGGGGGGGALQGSSHHHRERKIGRDVAPDLHDILIGGVGGVGIRHHNANHMTSLEVGMYVLLAAFCFAIVVFVISCVVYASKFKPHQSDGQMTSLPIFGASLRARAVAASQIASGRRPRESTTNAHDWVWLGRATLERAACTPQQVRVTNNPLAGEPEDDGTNELGTSFDNPNHIELPTSTTRLSSVPIDTTTYCKRDKTPRSFTAGNKQLKNQSPKLPNIVSASSRNGNNDAKDNPPPLPPHGISVGTSTATSDVGNNNNEDYKPPVPPHRDTGVTARLPETPKKNSHRSSGSHHVNHRHVKHHHHHHHHHHSKNHSNKNSKTDDLSQSSNINYNNDECIEMENIDKKPNKEIINSVREIKKATIVDNPMFSSTSTNSSVSSIQEPDTNDENDENDEEGEEEAVAIDDLNLGMDYNQIMQYFDNLKESNA